MFELVAYATGEGAATTDAALASQQAAGPLGMIAPLIMPILLIVIFYFLLIRPQRKRDKENKNMLANLKVGDNIITIGGIVGTIAKIKDEKIVVEIGTKTEKTLMTMERWAVREVIKPVSAD